VHDAEVFVLLSMPMARRDAAECTRITLLFAACLPTRVPRVPVTPSIGV
jgi:hypothetical protein